MEKRTEKPADIEYRLARLEEDVENIQLILKVIIRLLGKTESLP